MITYNDYQKVDIRIGHIISAEKVPDTDKLLKLSVDFGETETNETGEVKAKHRTIVSGIALYYSDLTVLVGTKCAFVVNLEPRTLRGIESQGMILAASVKEATEPVFSLLKVSDTIPAGTKVA